MLAHFKQALVIIHLHIKQVTLCIKCFSSVLLSKIETRWAVFFHESTEWSRCLAHPNAGFQSSTAVSILLEHLKKLTTNMLQNRSHKFIFRGNEKENFYQKPNMSQHNPRSFASRATISGIRSISLGFWGLHPRSLRARRARPRELLPQR